jgi:alpha-L-rhamnosidase
MSTSADRFLGARWIWDGSGSQPRNRWVAFRREIKNDRVAVDEKLSRWILHVTADARYRLLINRVWQGDGPARSWPDELYYDSYDITEALRSSNLLEISVLVRYMSPGTGSYIGADAGFAAELVQTGRGADRTRLVTDSSWICAEHPGYREPVTKMANGLAYAEVFRADLVPDDTQWCWRPAVDTGPAMTSSRKIRPRDIPALGDARLTPIGIISRRSSRSRGFFRSVDLRSVVFPADRDINKHKRFSGILAVGIQASEHGSGEIGLTVDPHDTMPVTLLLADQRFIHENGKTHPFRLKRGLNILRILLTGQFHDPVFHLQFVLPEAAALVPIVEGIENRTPFVFIGPLASASRIQAGDPVPPLEEDVLPVRSLEAVGEEELLNRCWSQVHVVPAECISPHHVALECLTAERGEPELFIAHIHKENRFDTDVKQSHTGSRIRWSAGEGCELIWDFGREVSGFLEFELEAAVGTEADFLCFESIHDGIIEHTFSLNNSLRYYSQEGKQHYHSFVRRGFRYVMTVFRKGSGTASLTGLALRESLYPTSRVGKFNSSDPLLNKIWSISRQTVALCMEDTYVDCPAYEQTYWTGDARNTALYSYYLFQAGALFLRSARLAARSLERSVLIESMAPSAWQNIIPSWSFLHVLAGVEYLFYTGDEKGFREIYPSLIGNMTNAAGCLVDMEDGGRLFALNAWNMIDWAPMDVPDNGLIAHQNALFVMACRALAEAAGALGLAQDTENLTAWADQVSQTARRRFWCPENHAFRDSLLPDGAPSTVFSVQTQLFMYMSGIAVADQKDSLERALTNPPAHFVEIESPFIRHFYYEVLLGWNRQIDIIQDIRKKWGYMIEKGATTCWEGWSLIPGHYTRSHCHAWSAAPAFFLPAVILGIRPKARGFREVEVNPYPGDLRWAEGAVATPFGPLEISWHFSGSKFCISINHPQEVSVFVDLPATLEHSEIVLNST